MESKFITIKEMKHLLEISSKPDHPYYYKFSYIRGGRFKALRVRKHELSNSRIRRSFHQVDVTGNIFLEKAINRLSSSSCKLEAIGAQ